MKKAILITTVLLVGVVACSKSGTDEKKEAKQEANTATTVSTSNSKSESSYEAEMLKRMEVVKKEVQPALESGVTADMNNASQKLGEAWEIEMKKVYDLLLSELPENEKAKLQKEQEKWAKKVKDEIAEDDKESEGGTIEILSASGTTLDNTEKRALELAKRYDQLHAKK